MITDMSSPPPPSTQKNPLLVANPSRLKSNLIINISWRGEGWGTDKRWGKTALFEC